MKNIIKLLSASSHVAIFGHTSVDQDCLGSAGVLKLVLESLGKSVDIFIGDDSYDKELDYLCDKSYFKKELMPENYDLFVAVDVAATKMLGVYTNDFVKFNNTLVIDHHMSNELYGKHNYVKNESSCCEIIFDLITKMGFKLNEKATAYLYAGIIADTQCLSTDSVNSKTFQVVSKLFDVEFDYSYILDRVFRVKSLNYIKLQTFVYENFKIDDGVAHLIVKNKNIKNILKGQQDCTFSCGEFINSILNIEGVKIAIIISQMEKNNYKVSFRCKKQYDVNAIAATIGGGGHKQASGAKFTGNAVEVMQKLIELGKKQIKELDCV